jgi:CRP-like cAMP-binding protein
MANLSPVPDLPSQPWPMRKPFLSLLPEKERWAVLECTRPHSFAANGVLFGQGTQAPPLMIMQSGFVKVLRSAEPPGSAPMLVDVLGADDILGLEDFVAGRPAHVSYVATKPTVALTMSRSAFTLLAVKYQLIDRLITRTLADLTLRRTAFLAYGALQVKQRVQAFLIGMAAAHGRADDRDSLVLDIGLTHSDISAAVGASEQRVRHAINALKTEGAISSGYRTIHIKNIDVLMTSTATDVAG